MSYLSDSVTAILKLNLIEKYLNTYLIKWLPNAISRKILLKRLYYVLAILFKSKLSNKIHTLAPLKSGTSPLKMNSRLSPFPSKNF